MTERRGECKCRLGTAQVCTVDLSLYAVVGGLLLSQRLTLYLTPVIYPYLDRLTAARSEGSKRGGAGATVYDESTNP